MSFPEKASPHIELQTPAIAKNLLTKSKPVFQPSSPTIRMDALSIVGASLRHSDTLYYLLQQKQEDYEKSAGNSAQSRQKLWNFNSVAELREELANIERHMSAHAQTSGKTLDEIVSDDEAYVIKHNLMSVKFYLYSLCNMSSHSFRADDITPATVNYQITEVIEVLKCVTERLNKHGIYSKLLQKGPANYYGNVSQLYASLVGAENMPIDKALRNNVEVFLENLKLDKDAPLNKNDNVRQFGNDDDSDSNESATNNSSDEELIKIIALAARALVDDITKRGGAPDQHVQHVNQLEKLWSGWQIDANDITYQYNAINQMIMLGQGTTSVVYAGLLKEGKDMNLPVAVKTKPLTTQNAPDVIREIFLHLMMQHHRIVTMFGIWYQPHSSTPALIVVEKMARTLEDGLKSGGNKIDRIAVLRDTAAAIAHLHDRGIVHGDVKPANVLLNEDETQAKLAGFGSSSCSSNKTTLTVGRQQSGIPFYMAPEFRENDRCKTTPKIDCWAFGLLICEVMNAAGYNAFVSAHRTDLHGAAKAWAGGIRDRMVKAAATACVQPDAKHRPLMKEVYLHLAGVVAIGDGVTKEVRVDSVGGARVSGSRSVNTLGESQEIAGRNWSHLFDVNPNAFSRRIRISVRNETEGPVELCRAQADGKLRSALRVEQSASGRLRKKKKDRGVFFVVRDARTHIFRAAFPATGYGVDITVGPNYVYFHGGEANLVNKGGALWPLRSATVSEQVPVTLENKLKCDYRVQRLDDSGCEVPLIENVAGPSQWTGNVSGGSILVFRWTYPGNASWDGAFDCAVGVPTALPGFTIKFN